MALTIGNWIFIGVLAVIGIVITFACYFDDEGGMALICLILTVVLCLGLMFGLSWWHNNTASGVRAMKDYHSNLDNGLNREITITAEDGREIFHYEGKVDVETKHEGNANYILFESEEGLRYIIYYGITDTVLIVEKAG